MLSNVISAILEAETFLQNLKNAQLLYNPTGPSALLKAASSNDSATISHYFIAMSLRDLSFFIRFKRIQQLSQHDILDDGWQIEPCSVSKNGSARHKHWIVEYELRIIDIDIKPLSKLSYYIEQAKTIIDE